MPDTKTTATTAAVGAFLDALADPAQRDDARTLAEMMARVSGEPATMWGGAIVGFGRYAYPLSGGKTGEMARIGFSPRKGQTVLYLTDGFPEHDALLARLGKHKTGKSCLYLKRLADVDAAVLEALIAASLARMDARYPR